MQKVLTLALSPRKVTRPQTRLFVALGVFFLCRNLIGQEISLSTGIDVSRGDYGLSEDTDTVAVPLTLTYSRAPLTVKGTLVGLRVDSPGGTSSGVRGGILASTATRNTRSSGLGDSTLSVTYAAQRPIIERVYLDATAKLKLPTGNVDKGLGTGTIDWTFQLDAFRSSGKFTPFATLGVRVMGQSKRFDFNNAFLFSAGFSVRHSDSLSYGLLLDSRTPITSTGRERRELVPFLSARPTKHWRIGAYGVVGLADGSPDMGGGLQLSYRFALVPAAR